MNYDYGEIVNPKSTRPANSPLLPYQRDRTFLDPYAAINQFGLQVKDESAIALRRTPEGAVPSTTGVIAIKNALTIAVINAEIHFLYCSAYHMKHIIEPVVVGCESRRYIHIRH